MMLGALEGMDGMRVSALAEILMIDISAASRQVSALETAGLVARIKDEVDHRAQLITLTPAGSAALSDACQTAGSEIAAQITAWSSHDVRLLTRMLWALGTDLVAAQPGTAKAQLNQHQPPALTQCRTFESVN